MSSLPSQPATDLRTAYRVCDVKPLEGDDLDHYYADLKDARKSEAMQNISTRLDLQESGEFSTILFTGHRGCGKSTELRLLERTWKEQYHVIYLEIDEVTDISDVEYTDLYLLVVQYLEYELRKLKIKLDQGILKDFENWFAEITEETEQTVENSISLEGEVTLGLENPIPIPFLAKLLAKLTSQIKGGAKEKKVIRSTLEKDFSRLKSSINLLLDDGTKKLRKLRPNCKGILFIFDNLDRCQPHITNHLFFDYAPQLQELRATIVYTVPISASYSPLNIANYFDKLFIVPMINIYEYEQNRDDLSHNNLGLQALVSLLQKRVDIKQIFTSDQELLDVIRASGGHIRHLIQMIREACITAISRGHQTIEADDITYAIKQLQFSFERVIPDIQYPILANTYRTKRAANDEIGQQTLFNTSVLEYNGTRRWNYPHPMVIKIDAFQRAVSELNQQP